MSSISTHSKKVKYGPYPELSIPGILMGFLIGAVLVVSTSYAALILGFTHECSDVAAILGFGILRGLMRRKSIIEINITQTIGSSINVAAAGIMFSVPALYILNHTDFNPLLMIFASIAGSVLGLAFIIPLRKQMIDYDRLAYPAGVAVATVLKSPGAGVKKAWMLGLGFLLSAGLAIITHYADFKTAPVGAWLGLPDYMNVNFYVSLLVIGTAFIAGKGGLVFIIGGYLCYFILAPYLNFAGLLPSAETLSQMGASMPDYLRVSIFRPVGIGMLIGGALMGIVLAFPMIKNVFGSLGRKSKSDLASSKDELSIKILYVAIVLAAILLFFVTISVSKEVGITRGLMVAGAGTLWIWLAGNIIAECLGKTNWNPLSGMTLIAVTIFVFILSGVDPKVAIITSVTVGAAVAMALTTAGDMMLDLKTGYLVGGVPKRQQIAQLISVWLGPIIVMVLIVVLHKAYTLGSERLPAPQGQALASMVSGILGGNVPVHKYIAGAGFGALLSLGGISGVIIGLSFYLPFYVIMTFTIGGVLRMIVDKVKGCDFVSDIGIPLAAGLIVGEALLEVAFAISKVLGGVI